ncbi:phosphopantetheine-binding protein [Nonomuraea sp. NPDC050643]|uniref:phosphopantetheine-binding protein n=1 Tax=Nonomuraea sp. NPDC050643 TaxID=3155660 RepID=UPI0033EA2334
MIDDLTDELRRFVADRLPSSMVPSLIVELAELPVTASGKVDQARLPAPRTAHAGSAAQASDGEEELIAAIFADVLNVRPVCADDNLFLLGGSSVHAIRVIARIADRFGMRIPALRFFRDPTVRALAAAVREQRTS